MKLAAAAILLLGFPLLVFASEPPVERMIGANFIFRSDMALCSATLFYAPERWVLTNHHCIENSIRIVDREEVQNDGTVKKVKRVFYDEITLSQPAYGDKGRVGELTLRARVLEFDKTHDIAVLQIISETTPLPHVAQIPDDTYKLRQGQTVFAIGNPAGLENTLTKGILSHLYREHRWSADQVVRYIQTDATIAGGSSGGSLYDEHGFLIGVPAAKKPGAELNFAIPISDVKAFLRSRGFAKAWDPTAPTRAMWLEEQKKKAKEQAKSEPPK